MLARYQLGFWAAILTSALALLSCAGSSPSNDTRAAACVTGVGDPSAPLVDDFEDGDSELLRLGERSGSWYASNDGTGIQAPPPDATRLKSFLSSAPGSPLSPKYALRTVGWGFMGWGAFVSANLNAPSKTLCSYDVSGLSGLQFLVKGSANLRVTIGTQATTPIAEGGQCRGDNCSDFGAAVAVTDDWTEVSVAFSDLTQPSWASPAPWTPAETVRLSFWVEQGAFDFWIDDVRLY